MNLIPARIGSQAAWARSRSAMARSWAICKFNQNRAEVPKRRASRIAVVAEIARLPCMISVIRFAGTPRSRANRREVILGLVEPL